MKKMLFSAALAMLITGCAQQTFTVGNKPTAVTPKETITHHFFVSGIGQKKTVVAAISGLHCRALVMVSSSIRLTA